MKRFSKILAAVLLLALCASVLGIFSAFAEDATTLAPTVIYDMDSKASLTNPTGGSSTKVDPNPNVEDDEYWQFTVDGSATAVSVITMSFDSRSIFQDCTPKNGSLLTENTDFLVVDFDIAQNGVSNLVDGLVLLTYRLKDGAKSTADAAGYITIGGTSKNDLSVSLGENTRTPAAALDDEWASITLVYDVSNDDPSNWYIYVYTDGYYAGYLFFTGLKNWGGLYRLDLAFPASVAGTTNLRNFTVTSYPVGWAGDLTNLRISSDKTSANNTLFEISELAYCVKGLTKPCTEHVDADANGECDNCGAAVEITPDCTEHVDEEPEYGKCDNCGAEVEIVCTTGHKDEDENNICDKCGAEIVVLPDPFGPTADKPDAIVTIKRDGTPTSYNLDEFKDFDANFAEGDLVTVHKAIDTPILVNVAPTTVTFIPADETCTYTLVDTTGVDFSTAKYVVLNSNTREVVGSGDATAFAVLGLGTNANPDYTIVMLGDLTRTSGSRYGGTRLYGRHITFDINGYTLTLAPTTQSHRMFNLNTADDGAGTLEFTDGNVIFNSATYLTEAAYGSSVIFDNVNLEVNYLYFIHQYDANVIIRNESVVDLVYLNASGATRYACFSTLEGNSNVNAGIEITDSTVNFGRNVATLANATNLGGLNVNVVINNSKLTSEVEGACVFTFTANCNKTFTDNTTFASDYKESFNVDVDIIDSEVNAGSLMKAALASLSYAVDENTTYYANGLDINIDIDVDNSAFNGDKFVYVDCASVVKEDTTTSYTYDVNVDADSTSKFLVSGGISDIRFAHDSINVKVTLAEGVLLSKEDINHRGSYPSNKEAALDLGADCVIARTSLHEGYSFIVTSNFRTYTTLVVTPDGIVVDHEGTNGSFEWNGQNDTEDPVNASVISRPSATTMCKYSEWEWNAELNAFVTHAEPNFKLSANLTALTDFHLNIYMPGNIAIDNIVEMWINGRLVNNFQEVTINGVTYYKVQDGVITNVAPNEVDGTHTVTMTVKGRFEEEFNLSTTVSVQGYLTRAHALNLEGNAGEFVQAIIDYVVIANNYNGTPNETLAALASDEIAEPTWGEVKWETGVVSGITGIRLDLEDTVSWVFEATAGAEYTFEYAGISSTITAGEDGLIKLSVKAIYLLEDITITDANGNTATVNLAGYRNALEDNAAVAVVDAMYYYSVAASAYANETAGE